MGNPWTIRRRRKPTVVAASPNEESLKLAQRYTHEATKKGFKAAIVTSFAATVPTLYACRVFPWAKANLNHTTQALIISAVLKLLRGRRIDAASIATYFITADKHILESAMKNAKYIDKKLA